MLDGHSAAAVSGVAERERNSNRISASRESLERGKTRAKAKARAKQSTRSLISSCLVFRPLFLFFP